MKKILLLFLTLSSVVKAQELISNTTGNFYNENYVIFYSVGQIFTPFSSNSWLGLYPSLYDDNYQNGSITTNVEEINNEIELFTTLNLLGQYLNLISDDNNFKNACVFIYNVQGVCMNKQIVHNNTSISLNNLPPSVYVAVLNISGNEVIRMKIIKK